VSEVGFDCVTELKAAVFRLRRHNTKILPAKIRNEYYFSKIYSSIFFIINIEEFQKYSHYKYTEIQTYYNKVNNPFFNIKAQQSHKYRNAYTRHFKMQNSKEI
jgi:hypothetical protein